MPLLSGKCRSKARLTGKTAIVTGCNTGIGKETVMDFYKRGAKVIMACRSLDKAEAAKSDIKMKCKDLPDTGNIVVEKCDLSSLNSVREFAKKVLDTEPQINILVNNAGVMMCPKGETEDGFETQFGTNHLAHFLLTVLLLPRIRNSTPARIVTVSSALHARYGINFDDLNYKKRSYSAAEAYSQSKIANVLFSQELAARLKEYGIQGINTYSLHPGVIKTEILRNLDDTTFWGARKTLNILVGPFMKSPESGAQTTIYCAVDEKCAAETGLYYSDCVVKRPASNGSKKEYAKKLWEMSAEMVKLGDYNPFTANDPGVKTLGQ
ncbi:retinol dehydrogenase 13-like [Trichoplusia ni]|uniref:Retinol dehydrogenase 13-like n=1 Tax=Trichoplusia ni TaxID=7111 RepID=A0A7E5VDJ6_TRINI|nr:retinol dehydrogenase 13-like [Trichoplusia ni]XP_026726345.1 retinol dehydrogenase 13-like [Trichoplusia ni]XP_026726346.1 retinol dehydrogenase 13-like [Trichoplusia ni]